MTTVMTAEARRVEAEAKLTLRLLAAEEKLSALVESVNAALEASGEAYNAGPRTGRSTATRDTIAARISHRLRVECGIPDFEQSLSPTGRTALGEAAQPRPALRGYVPPRNRKDVRGEPEYPGQALGSRPIIQTFLKDDSDSWVEVAPGDVDLPAEPYVPPKNGAARDALDMDAIKARHRKQEAEARALKRQAAAIKVPGET